MKTHEYILDNGKDTLDLLLYSLGRFALFHSFCCSFIKVDIILVDWALHKKLNMEIIKTINFFILKLLFLN